MEMGDIIKVIESVRNNKTVKKRTTKGTFVSLGSNLTICRLHNGEKTWNISYSIGDLKDCKKEFYVKTNTGWQKLNFSVKESEGNDI